jgi:SNF2 family DNA or RNA helicase
VTHLALPLGIVGGYDASVALDAARKRFRSLDNGWPRCIDDFFAILLLCGEEEEENDEEDPVIVGAKVQMVQLGFGPRLPSLSKTDRLSMLALAAYRLAGHTSVSIERALRSEGVDMRESMRQIWSRLVRIYRMHLENRERLSERSAQLDVELEGCLPQGLSLRPHQHEAVLFARDRGWSCIFGDEMGLGKTVEILSCIALRGSGAFPTAIVCRKSLLSTWTHESKKWLSRFDPLVFRVSRSTNLRDIVSKHIGSNVILLMTYDGLRTHGDVIQKMRVPTLVCDESHYLASVESQRSQSALRAASTADSVVCATGTLMPNGRHVESYVQLRMVDSNLCDHLHGRDDYLSFAQRYGDPTPVPVGKYMRGPKKGQVRFSVQYKGRSHSVEFGALCAKRYIRRTKSQVWGNSADGIPPKARLLRYIDLSDRVRADLAKEHQAVRDMVAGRASELRSELSDKGLNPELIQMRVKKVLASEVVMMMTKMRVKLGLAKAGWFVERALELLEEGHEVLLFCWHREVAHAVSEGIRKKGVSTILLDGSMTQKKRDAGIAALEAVHARVGVLTSAYREGLTLVGYNRMLFVERWHRPGDEMQAEDRIHRIGQTRDVAIEFGVVRGTYDEVMTNAQQWKEDGSAQVDGSADTRLYEWVASDGASDE